MCSEVRHPEKAKRQKIVFRVEPQADATMEET
jgi:hypothetical protein